MASVPEPYLDVFASGPVRVPRQVPHGLHEVLQLIDGASIYGADEVFLGRLRRDRYAPDATGNRFGAYGSPYEAHSIVNRYGTYGSRYEELSAYCPYSTKPPHLMAGALFVAYVTVNEHLQPRVHPDQLSPWFER